MIKLEGDVQITGQLLQGGRIVGTEPDGNGLKELVLVGDPIKLNGGGGILGLAASLVGTLAAGGFSLGTLGASLTGFGGFRFSTSSTLTPCSSAMVLTLCLSASMPRIASFCTLVSMVPL